MNTSDLFLIIANIWIARGCDSRGFSIFIGLLYLIVAVMSKLSGQ